MYMLGRKKNGNRSLTTRRRAVDFIAAFAAMIGFIMRDMATQDPPRITSAERLAYGGVFGF